MKKSIKKQIAFTFIGLMLFTLITIWGINKFFLESYYMSDKVRVIHAAHNELNVAQNYTHDLTTEFWNYCSKNNLSVLVTTAQGSLLYGSGMNSEKLEATLFSYFTGTDRRKEHTKVIESSQRYIIQRNKDRFLNTDYLEMWGFLDNGDCFLVRTPLESIRESVNLANRFLAVVGMFVISLSVAIVWWLSSKVAKPILELTNISKRMADLEFDVKYESGGSNEVGVLGENFNRMSEELEKAISGLKTANNELQTDIEKKVQIDEMRKEFLSNVSHELKTPIALIQGYAEGLKENINEDEESREFYCDVIMDEANKMNKMVKKLLTLNQLECGNEQITMERFDIVALIKGTLQSSHILIEQKGVKIRFHEKESIQVWGDEFKVEEVVTNYLTNALNHVNDEKIIEIRILQEDGQVKVCVFNTGNPIPEGDIDKVWIKFYKVDKARTREYGGNGIGLSIVKAIMESMHQECGVKNYNNGVEFWFTLDAK